MIHDAPGPALRRMYEEFVASIGGIAWESDAESRQLTFVSPEAERVLGYPVAKLIRLPKNWEQLLPKK